MLPSLPRDQRRQLPSRRGGQAVVEYVLAVAVLAVALAVGFIAFGEAARGVFDNVRRTVQMPYP
jgi:Flp pilus assembly pilin Flp